MPRAVWSGIISFGLVNVPVELFTAIQEKTVHFHLLSADGKCRLRRKLFCPETGKEYEYADTVRGYEVAPDQYVTVTDEELEALEPEGGKTFEIEHFIDQSEIDPILYRGTYYVAPGDGAGKAFGLLREVLTRSKKVALGKVVMREKQYLAAIRPYQDHLVLDTLYYSDEVRDTSQLPSSEKGTIRKEELDLALKLVESGTLAFNPAQYKDDYRLKVEELIDEKAHGKGAHKVTKGKARVPTNIVDLTDALKKSLRASKGGGPKRPGKRAANE